MFSEFLKQPKTLFDRMTADAVRMGQHRPFIHALVELDITELRKGLRIERREGIRQTSLTAVIVSALSRAIGQKPEIQRMRDVFGRFRVPTQVDVFFPLEYEDDGEFHLVPLIIRNAHEIKPHTIDRKLRDVAENGPKPSSSAQRFFLHLPWFIKKWFYKIWLGIPRIRKAYFGTVYVSSIINYSADRRTWGVPIPLHSMGIFIGTTSKRTVTCTSGVESRDMIQITVSVDHRVQNGGDMGRFVHRLKHLLEVQIPSEFNVNNG